ncbi:hypothetical protein [Hydrogenivirga sp.]
MKRFMLLILALFLVIPGFGAEKKRKKTYVAKTKKSVKYKKKYKRRVYIRKYPVRSNTARSGEELKLQELVKDIYE